jgi:hypothetical protein
MTDAMTALHWLAGVVVLAEALNKLERTAPFAKGLCAHTRLVDLLKSLAWMLLALGGAGAVASPVLLAMGVQSGDMPLLRLERATLSETCVLLGFAVLIVRTRVKEG